MGKKAKLNLGAGNRIIEDAVNHDFYKHRPEIDVEHDLNILPWPWLRESFDEVHAVSVFEHLSITLIQALDECWRILKPEGRLLMKYPLWNTPTAHDDPTHRWYWSEKVLEFFDPDKRYCKEASYYTQYKWKILNIGLIKERNVMALLEPRGKCG